MKVSALSDALQSVEDGGMLTTDEESNGSVRSSYDEGQLPISELENDGEIGPI